MSLSSGDTPTITHLLTPSTSPSQAHLCRGNKSIQSGILRHTTTSFISFSFVVCLLTRLPRLVPTIFLSSLRVSRNQAHLSQSTYSPPLCPPVCQHSIYLYILDTHNTHHVSKRVYTVQHSQEKCVVCVSTQYTILLFLLILTERTLEDV